MLMLYSILYILFQIMYVVCFDGINEVSQILKMICLNNYLIFMHVDIFNFLPLLLQFGKNYVYSILKWNDEAEIGKIEKISVNKV